MLFFQEIGQSLHVIWMF